MTCLQIGFPHLRPATLVSNIGDPQINNKCGIVSGFRHNLIYSEDIISSWFVDFDYGSIFAPDYLYIAKLALTKGITAIGLATSPDNVTWSGVYSTTAINYQGNNNQDFFATFEPIGPSRYWRVSFGISPAAIMRLSKIYLGNLFTFDKDLSTKTKQRVVTRDTNTFTTTSARVYRARSTKRLNSWDIVVNNISDLNLEKFLDEIIDIEKRYVVLYDSQARKVFNDQAVWHGIIDQDTVAFEKVQADTNKVTFTFKEMP